MNKDKVLITLHSFILTIILFIIIGSFYLFFINIIVMIAFMFIKEDKKNV